MITQLEKRGSLDPNTVQRLSKKLEGLPRSMPLTQSLLVPTLPPVLLRAQQLAISDLRPWLPHSLI